MDLFWLCEQLPRSGRKNKIKKLHTTHNTVDCPVPVLDLRLLCMCVAVGVCCFLREAWMCKLSYSWISQPPWSWAWPLSFLWLQKIIWVNQPMKTKGLFDLQFEFSLWPSASVGCRPLMRKHSMARAPSKKGAAQCLGWKGEGRERRRGKRRRRRKRGADGEGKGGGRGKEAIRLPFWGYAYIELKPPTKASYRLHMLRNLSCKV